MKDKVIAVLKKRSTIAIIVAVIVAAIGAENISTDQITALIDSIFSIAEK